MAPHFKDLPEQEGTRLLRLPKDGGGYKNISRLLNLSRSTVVAVVTRYSKSHTTNDRRACWKIMPCTIWYLHSHAFKNRRINGPDLAEGVHVEIGAQKDIA